MTACRDFVLSPTGTLQIILLKKGRSRTVRNLHFHVAMEVLSAKQIFSIWKLDSVLAQFWELIDSESHNAEVLRFPCSLWWEAERGMFMQHARCTNCKGFLSPGTNEPWAGSNSSCLDLTTVVSCVLSFRCLICLIKSSSSITTRRVSQQREDSIW